MQPLQPLVLNNFSKGIHTNVNNGLVSPDILKYSLNMFNDPSRSKIGTLKSRYGNRYNFGNIGDDIALITDGDQIQGLTSYNTDRLIAAVRDVTLAANTIRTYAYNGSAWVDIGAAPVNWWVSDNTIVRFENFIDYVFGVTSDGSIFYSWNKNTGTNWGTTNLASFPGIYTFQFKAFQGRLYAPQATTSGANERGKIYFSSLPNASNIISWNSADYLKYGGEDDSDLTALERNGGLLLIFKKHSLYTYDGVSTQSSPLYNVGAISPEVIQTINNITFFAEYKTDFVSIYAFNGGEPVDISEPVREFLYISNSKWVGGSWNDGENYYLSIKLSAATIFDDVSYTSIILCYNIKNKSWTYHYTNYDDYGISFGTLLFSSEISTQGVTYIPVIAGGKETASIGVDTFPVMWNDNRNLVDDITDASTKPIDILIQTQKMDWGSRNQKKQVNQFYVIASGNYNFIEVTVRIDGGEWINLGGLTDKRTKILVGLQGYEFEFRLSGTNTGEQFILEEIDFFDVQIEDYET